MSAGGLKPQSDIAFEAVNEPVKKIATWLAVVNELLEDVPGLAAYLNTRLMHFVRPHRGQRIAERVRHR